MVKLVRKFVTDIRLSKLNAVKYSGIVAFLIFATSVTYKNLMGTSVKDAIITSGISAAILFVALYFMCFAIVKQMDKKDARIEAEKQREEEEGLKKEVGKKLIIRRKRKIDKLIMNSKNGEG